MWLISNPLFEIGAGLVLIAATVWMLLNAIAPRPVVAPPLTAAPTAIAPAVDPLPTLGPMAGRTPRTMYLADEEETASAEPPLRLNPQPPPPRAPAPAAMVLSEAGPPPIEPPAPVVETIRQPAPPPGLDEPPPVETATPAVEEPVAAEEILEPPPTEEPPSVVELPAEPAFVEILATEAVTQPPSATEIAEPAASPEAALPAALDPPARATPIDPGLPTEPGAPPTPAPPFETRFRGWLEDLLRAAPGAPPMSTVVAASARVKRSVDPAWLEPARDLRAAIETLGKLAPAAFVAPGAREATAALAEAAGPPFVLVWPEVGARFDPVRHAARSGEGEVVAAVVRPGVAYGEGASALPALVVRGSAPPNSASA